MYWSRKRLKEMARTALHGSYWKTVLAALIMLIATAGAAFNGTTITVTDDGVHLAAGSLYRIPPKLVIFFVGTAVVAACVSAVFYVLALLPAEVGCCAFFNKDLYAPAEVSEISRGFDGNYWNVVKVQFFRILYTFLWALLLIVPGIIKSYEYRMIPYILAEDPDIDRKEAFERSRAMMNGEKWETFMLDLTFIGWFLLSAFTFGLLGIFYVNPYYFLTNTALYGALKRKMTILGANSSVGTGNEGFDAAGGAADPENPYRAVEGDAPFVDDAAYTAADASWEVVSDPTDGYTDFGGASATGPYGAAVRSDGDGEMAEAGDQAGSEAAENMEADLDEGEIIEEDLPEEEPEDEVIELIDDEPELVPDEPETKKTGPADAPWVIYEQEQQGNAGADTDASDATAEEAPAYDEESFRDAHAGEESPFDA